MTLRKVVGHEWCGACRYTGYEDKSIRLVLDCGHPQAARKASDFRRGIPKRAHCRYCERALGPRVDPKYLDKAARMLIEIANDE